MAVRGVLTTIEIYPSPYTSGDPLLHEFQNYFPDPTVIGSRTYTHAPFKGSAVTASKSSLYQSFSLTFPATVEYIDIVENAIENKLYVAQVMYRWSATEGLENPSTFNNFSYIAGKAARGSTDFSSITLEVETYAKTVDSDFPGRKIPWTVLSPLSFRDK